MMPTTSLLFKVSYRTILFYDNYKTYIIIIIKGCLSQSKKKGPAAVAAPTSSTSKALESPTESAANQSNAEPVEDLDAAKSTDREESETPVAAADDMMESPSILSGNARYF